MRIGLLAADFHPNVGGVAAHVVELGRALVRAGHSVDVFTLPLGDERAAESALHGMRVHRPSIPKGKPLYTWLMRAWLYRFLRRQPLDVLHVHGLRPLEATFGVSAPVIFTNHTSGFLKRIKRGPAEHRRLLSRMAHLAHVLAPSHELVEATRTVGFSGPVDFISNGVDVERFSPGQSTCRADWTANDNEKVVLLARRLVDKNGVRVFAEAVTRLAHRTDARFIFAGDGPERGAVEQIIDGAGMLDRCVFLGNVANTQMPDIYRSADISVLPSFMEATSITGLESMATGLPLVGTRVGGIPAIVDDQKTGLLVDPGNPEQLASELERLLSDDALRTGLGKAARDRAVAEFSWDGIAGQTADVYARYIESDLRRAA